MITVAFIEFLFSLAVEAWDWIADALADVPWAEVLGAGAEVATGAALAAGAFLLFDYLDKAKISQSLDKIMDEQMKKNEKFRDCVQKKMSDRRVVSISQLRNRYVQKVETLNDGSNLVHIDVDGIPVKLAAKKISSDIKPGIAV